MYNIVANQFENHSKRILSDMINSNEFTDVTFVCDEQKQISAHKSIVSSCSPVLKTIIRSNPHPNPLIYLRGINYLDLQAVLQYMYLGEVNIPEERLTEFLNLAKEFSIIGLTDNTNSFKIKGLGGNTKQNIQAQPKQNTKETSPVINLSEETSFNCQKCDRTFKSKERLNHHSKYIHKNTNKNCTISNQKFKDEGSLQSHMQSVDFDLNVKN